MSSPPARMEKESPLVLTFLGCGNMGMAILTGIVASLAESRPDVLSASGAAYNIESGDACRFRLPTRFIACVRRPESAKKVSAAVAQYGVNLETLVNDNLEGVTKADVVVLGCKPHMFRDILKPVDIKEALAGKLLISVMAGVQAAQIEEHLYGSLSTDPEKEGRCRVVRVLPNTASAVRESMTVIAATTPPLSDAQSGLVTWMFDQVGKVVHLAPNLVDASTALCGSAPAFMAMVLEALADGGVAMGIPRAEAQYMAAQVLRGTAALVQNGEHPAVLKDKVCSPGGCTIAGVLEMEEGKVRGTVSRAVCVATKTAAGLGKPK